MQDYRHRLQDLALAAVLENEDPDYLASAGISLFNFKRTREEFVRSFVVSFSGDLARKAGAEDAAEYVATLFDDEKFEAILKLEEPGSIERLKTGAISIRERMLAMVDFPIDRANEEDVLEGLVECQTFATFEEIRRGEGSGFISANYQETDLTFSEQLIAPGAELGFVTDERGRFLKYLLYYTGRDDRYFEADKKLMRDVETHLNESGSTTDIQVGFVSALNGIKAEEDKTITKSEELLAVALLFRHAALELREKGCNAVALTVREDNVAAKGIYEGLGFRSIPELAYEKEFIDETGVPVLCKWSVMYSPLTEAKQRAVVEELDKRIYLLQERTGITTVIADFDDPDHFAVTRPSND